MLLKFDKNVRLFRIKCNLFFYLIQVHCYCKDSNFGKFLNNFSAIIIIIIIKKIIVNESYSNYSLLIIIIIIIIIIVIIITTKTIKIFIKAMFKFIIKTIATTITTA